MARADTPTLAAATSLADRAPVTSLRDRLKRELDLDDDVAPYVWQPHTDGRCPCCTEYYR